MAALGTLTVTMVLVPPFEPGAVVGEYVRPSDLVVRIWVCAAILMPAVRLMRSQAYRYLRRKYRVGAPALILGSGPIAYQLILRMRQVPEYGLNPIGLLDDFRPPEVESLDVPYLGGTHDLEAVARRLHVEDLIVAPSSVSDEQLARAAQVAQTLGIRVFVVPRLFDAVGVGTRVEHLGGIPLLVLARVDPKGWQFALKHGFDRTMAAVGLTLISPLFLTLALLVKATSARPGLLPAAANWPGLQGLRLSEVPQHASLGSVGGELRAQGGGRAGWGRRASTVAPGSARSCARRRWTSCPSCSTCSTAT